MLGFRPGGKKLQHVPNVSDDEAILFVPSLDSTKNSAEQERMNFLSRSVCTDAA